MLPDLLDSPPIHAAVDPRARHEDGPLILALKNWAELIDVPALAHLGTQEQRVRRLKPLSHLVRRLDPEAVPVVPHRHVLVLAVEDLELHGVVLWLDRAPM